MTLYLGGYQNHDKSKLKVWFLLSKSFSNSIHTLASKWKSGKGNICFVFSIIWIWCHLLITLKTKKKLLSALAKYCKDMESICNKSPRVFYIFYPCLKAQTEYLDELFILLLFKHLDKKITLCKEFITLDVHLSCVFL